MAVRVVLYSRSGDTSDVEAALRAAVVEYAVWSEELGAGSGEFDLAVSWGGDGTFLDCVRRLGHLPVLGVNSGRLGFLANVPREQMAAAFAELSAGHYTVSQRALLNVSWRDDTTSDGTSVAGDSGTTATDVVSVTGMDGTGVERATAFNDFVIQRGGTGMISVEAAIDGQPVATYWGDGVIVATPAGSTAYSLSVGGPVIAPGCACLLLAPIAPHNLTMRPIVVPEGSLVELRISTRDRYAYASLDDSRREVPGGTLFTLCAGPSRARLVELPGHSFYRTLREKMLWGVDPRSVVSGE